MHGSGGGPPSSPPPCCWTRSPPARMRLFPSVVPPGSLAIAAGIIGVAVNAGPALVPLLFTLLPSPRHRLLLLAAIFAATSLAYAACAYRGDRVRPRVAPPPRSRARRTETRGGEAISDAISLISAAKGESSAEIARAVEVR